jgi:hypothetical protein
MCQNPQVEIDRPAVAELMVDVAATVARRGAAASEDVHEAIPGAGASERVKLNETSGGWFYLTGLLGLDGGARLVDPHFDGQGRGCRALAAEPVRAGGEGVV